MQKQTGSHTRGDSAQSVAVVRRDRHRNPGVCRNWAIGGFKWRVPAFPFLGDMYLADSQLGYGGYCDSIAVLSISSTEPRWSWRRGGIQEPFLSDLPPSSDDRAANALSGIDRNVSHLCRFPLRVHQN